MRLYVPRGFWTDYSARFEKGTPTAVRVAGPRVLIEGTPDQIEHLRADATYYAGVNMDDAPAWLRRSAAATLKVLP